MFIISKISSVLLILFSIRMLIIIYAGTKEKNTDKKNKRIAIVGLILWLLILITQTHPSFLDNTIMHLYLNTKNYNFQEIDFKEIKNKKTQRLNLNQYKKKPEKIYKTQAAIANKYDALWWYLHFYNGIIMKDPEDSLILEHELIHYNINNLGFLNRSKNYYNLFIAKNMIDSISKDGCSLEDYNKSEKQLCQTLLNVKDITEQYPSYLDRFEETATYFFISRCNYDINKIDSPKLKMIIQHLDNIYKNIIIDFKCK